MIKTKTVGELKDYSFFVPSYQRGYRWTKNEVEALLNDIYEFSTEGNQKYCLQPLIVKRKEDGSYEVVDGQQRLTTIYIFMKIASQEIRSATPPFSIEYKTREDSAEFLKILSDDMDRESKNVNIDYYHIVSTYDCINDWLDRQPDKSVAIQKLNTKIREYIFFIWYEINPEVDPISMFTKVNLGKIPLTNSELIKALLLNKDNFGEDVYKQQMEIAISWERIEQGLRDDSFWYFLNEVDKSGTRIDMLFELKAKEYNNKLEEPIETNQNLFSFLVFLEQMNGKDDKEKIVEKLWEDIESLYAEFKEWYDDLDKYHIIGYLISVGVSISKIFSLTRNRRKSAVKRLLLEEAKSTLGKYDLDNLFYDNSNDRIKIRRILLLFNIATLVIKSEKQYRFPFDIYKGESGERIKWDIEHIHASGDETDEGDDNIGNLTLLDSKTNRSYKESSFDIKRKIIIDREAKGLFVPLCTKNVFLKVYSDDLSNMSQWTDQDKEDYKKAININLEMFLKGGQVNG